MNDWMPLLLIMAMTNKKGFNSIKNAIEAADNFQTKFNNFGNIFSMLPNLMGGLNALGGIPFPNSAPGNNNNNNNNNTSQYIDTLKDVIAQAAGAKRSF